MTGRGSRYVPVVAGILELLGAPQWATGAIATAMGLSDARSTPLDSFARCAVERFEDHCPGEATALSEDDRGGVETQLELLLTGGDRSAILGAAMLGPGRFRDTLIGDGGVASGEWSDNEWGYLSALVAQTHAVILDFAKTPEVLGDASAAALAALQAGLEQRPPLDEVHRLICDAVTAAVEGDPQLRDPGPPGQWLAELTTADDAVGLEVHQAINVPPAPRPSGTGPVDLPLYVEREHDRRVRDAVEAAAAGRSGIAVLVGGSSTGKTRACWEALQLLREAGDPWRVWHPLDPEALTEGLPYVGPRTVVWLNEAQHYLRTPGRDLGERVAGALRNLLRAPGAGPVLVLATLWPQHAGPLTALPDPEATDDHPHVRALFEGALIPVASAFTGADLAAVRAAADQDPRLAYAVEHADDGEITQYLAGGPALIARYESALDSTAQAVVTAAMDARRLGHGPALPETFLATAAPGYLTDTQWNRLDEGWFERALADATAACVGANGPLTRIRPRDSAECSALYRVADYLEHHGRRTRRGVLPPQALWDAVRDHATAPECVSLGDAAADRWRLSTAFELYSRATQLGNTDAEVRVAELLRKVERVEEALTWYPRAEEGRTINAAVRVGDLWREAGEIEEALAWYTRAADAGNASAVVGGAELIQERRGTEQALAWLTERDQTGNAFAAVWAGDLLQKEKLTGKALTSYIRAAEAGSAEAAQRAGDLLWKMGQREKALTSYSRAVDGGSLVAALRAGSLLKVARRVEEALAWYSRAFDDGLADAAVWAGDLFREAGHTQDALNWYARAADAGSPSASARGADLLRTVEGTDQAVAWLTERDQAGDNYAAQRAGDLLWEAGHTEEALARYAGSPDIGAAWRAAGLLQGAGRAEEALTWYARVADAGDPAATQRIAELLWELGRIKEALNWLADRHDAGDTVAAFVGARLLQDAERTEEALNWYIRAADAGSSAAAGCAANLMHKAGRIEEAERLRRYGWRLDGSVSEPWPAFPPPWNIRQRR